jgi:hypothetical protein
MKKLILSGLMVCAVAFPRFARAAEAELHGEAPKEANEELTPKTLDGVFIEAVENYPNPHTQEVGLGLGMYPFKPYYYGFSLTGDYVKYFSSSLAWEIVNASIAFTVDTNLSSQLAQNYGVNPQSIERLKALFSSNAMYIFSHGKLLFLNSYIRYFRSVAIGGLGLVTTSASSQMAANVGIRFDAFVTDSFSWKLEIRDMMTFSGFENFAVVMLGTGFSF